ncbi:MAG: hypothetical protein A3C35_07915 [Omnitrophica bacterium RIFCSPHIGHO2_02_FULL_46_11]|nr:MAG: hypothetical protein A3C35_07915 [Omnitrophica bacterium RIFCSPHIGHO2_02_FULL_46_11]OGW87281.1 MAG: hypothetical protein A3A81_03705 [Omnitrophica bacterium RIFCSPLOWO2_01_FULL_45_10b]
MKFDAVIFDIDNVLIDTRASYTDCIRKTVETYLISHLKFQSSRNPLLSRQDVETFKRAGGFNDDWDTCYGLLLYLLSLKIKKCTLLELARVKNIPKFVLQIKQRPLGIKGIERLLRPHLERCLAMTSLRASCLPAGRKRSNLKIKEMVSLKRIAEIFQRFYLSDFVWNEKPLIPKSFLKDLKRRGFRLGIVTGRNREEAEFALRRFKMDFFIDAMMTTDETPKDLKKPHPYGLLKIAAKLGRNLRYLYVGDLPDDILAAKKAGKEIKIASCGYLGASTLQREMKREFKKEKADYICKEPKQLLKIIVQRTVYGVQREKWA